ncbi:MAG: hypothetical protein C4316_09980 [Chloroflexota bacterium]
MGFERTTTPNAVPLGVSRPPLEVQDLPTPEEVFRLPKIGLKETVFYVIGPSLIALGISIGSGEWLLGPLNVSTYGFYGTGFVILISIILQAFYNMEIGRWVIATGEVPSLGWARVPPGWQLWVPLSLIIVYFAFLWGGWAASAGQSLFALLTGRIPQAADLPTVRLLAVALMGTVFVITLFGAKIGRTLELVNWFLVGFILITLFIVCLLVVPFSKWVEGLGGIFTPALPPPGTDATLIGALAGFAAMASGLNWWFMNYYRDKGYGMGHRVGYIAALVGGRQEPVAPVGKIFPEDEKNARLWRRWWRFLALEMWVVFAPGAFLGMFLPTILVSHLASLPGVEKPTAATMPTYAADILGRFYNPIFSVWALVVGFFILYSTQLGVFELLVRNVVDALNGVSPGFRRLIHEDPRRFYYPYMLVLAIVISVLLHLALPTGLILISANMSNLGALIYPFLLMYLNSKLPRPARMAWWSYVVLILNFLFFGFFFINFAVQQLTGTALVRF